MTFEKTIKQEFEVAMKTRNYLTKTLITVLLLITNFLFAGMVQEVNFDSTDANTPVEQVITLSNSGDLPLAIYTIELKSNDGSFELAADSAYTIESGEEVEVAVNFVPTTDGVHTAELYLESNDEENAEVTLNLSGIGKATTTTAVDDFNDVPTEFGLNQNYPNPFNPTTNIKYQVPQSSRVSLTVYNMLGQKVATLANEFKTAGYHNVVWNATDDFGQHVSSGVYFLRMQAGDFTKTMRMTFTK